MQEEPASKRQKLQSPAAHQPAPADRQQAAAGYADNGAPALDGATRTQQHPYAGPALQQHQQQSLLEPQQEQQQQPSEVQHVPPAQQQRHGTAGGGSGTAQQAAAGGGTPAAAGGAAAASAPALPAAQGTVGAYTQREEHLQRQEAAGDIEFAYVVNDGQPHNMIRLMGLKVIFSKQLPNMPREYICRLLLDRRHRSVALVGKNGVPLGGITYRVFPQQGFGEIAFCAVAASQQVRGFGTRLMNHTKQYARDKDALTHFLTYADNNAVGYFTKQGFTREISLPRERWVGFIKDYDGGTLMEAVIHPKVPYADLVTLFRVQKDYLDSQIRQLSNSHIVHPGIHRQMVSLVPSHERVKQIALPLQPEDIPGVLEAGWSATHATKPGYRLVLRDGTVAEPSHGNLQKYMAELLSAVQSQDEAWPFREPVDAGEALDYYDIIPDPVDISLITARLGSRHYYVSLEMFVADIRKMCENCKYYNAPSTPYFQCATKLLAFVEQYLDNSIMDAVAAEKAAAAEAAAAPTATATGENPS